MKSCLCILLSMTLLSFPSSAAHPDATPDALALPAHALVLTMLERGLDYNASDPTFVWLSAYYALTLSAFDDAQAVWTADRLTLPADRLTPLLAQMFSALTSLPAQPGALRSVLTHSPDRTRLWLAAGDPGQTQLIWLGRQDGHWLAALVSPDADSPLCHVRIGLNRAGTAIESCIVSEQLPQTRRSAAVVISGYGHRRTD